MRKGARRAECGRAAPASADADGGDLGVGHPDARQAIDSVRRDAQLCEQRHQRRLHPPQEPLNVLPAYPVFSTPTAVCSQFGCGEFYEESGSALSGACGGLSRR